MTKLILFFLFFSLNIFAQQNAIVRNAECILMRGAKNEKKIFTLHDNYSLMMPFDNLGTFLFADHGGEAGFPGSGYRYTVFVRDPKIGGFVQGASSSIMKSPLPLQDIQFEDRNFQVKVRCRGRR